MVKLRLFLLVGVLLASAIGTSIYAAELPVLHLRKTATVPPLLAKLQDPATASAWYPSSPTWFGLGGKTGDRNHTEVLVTYDNTALYIAFTNIDRSTIVHPKGAIVDLTTVDSNAIWIETPQGKRYYLLAGMDANYPPAPRQASGELTTVDAKKDSLTGWSHTGWYAGDKTIQQAIKIPWSTLKTTAPVAGSKWRINFVNYNQTSSTLTASTVSRQMWAPGNETQPTQWGYLAFDEAAYTKNTTVSPEATLTLRPATGFGEEVTLRAGNNATSTNGWPNEAITQSNWNDWDPIDYTIKEFMQFDLSMIPKGRKIISATLQNRFRGHFESSPTDLYLHVVRLGSQYDPKTVTMLTSPLPVENGFRRLVTTAEAGKWVDFDVTDIVTKAFDNGASKVSLALAGSSGDIHNGKIWDTSFGRADYYDKYRPKLIITFGDPAKKYSTPVLIGSTNYTSVATTSSKNKLTNGTFKYGTVEGISNTTYWLDPGSLYINSQNVPLLRLMGDINPKTGHTAARFMTLANWKSIIQIATGLAGGKKYTFSGWYKGSASGIKSDVRLEFRDASGKALGSGQAVYSGSGNWEQVKLTQTAPAGTVKAKIEIVNWTSGTGTYMLYSDLQFEEGSTPTAYSETMGIYYPNNPRLDGSQNVTAIENSCIGDIKKMPVGSTVSLQNRLVTYSSPGFFYIRCPEQDHVACGIKVVSSIAPAVGSTVNVSGSLGKDSNDELCINASSVDMVTGLSAVLLNPLGFGNREICGGTNGMQIGATGTVGINLVGSLQTTWGKVSNLVANSSMIVNDGSKCPVKVLGSTGAAANGSFVRVTGVSGIEKSGGVYSRVLRTRTAADIIVISK